MTVANLDLVLVLTGLNFWGFRRAERDCLPLILLQPVGMYFGAWTNYSQFETSFVPLDALNSYRPSEKAYVLGQVRREGYRHGGPGEQ